MIDITDEALQTAYREMGKSLHPDAGGGEGEFSDLRDAYAVLLSPSRRLQLWLELRGTPGEIRGSIDAPLMDLFSHVSGVTQRAEAVIRKRDEAKSTLVKALLENETQWSREAVEQAISQIDAHISVVCGMFPELEILPHVDVPFVSKIARNLAFLEKWRASLRLCYSRLV